MKCLVTAIGLMSAEVVITRLALCLAWTELSYLVTFFRNYALVG